MYCLAQGGDLRGKGTGVHEQNDTIIKFEIQQVLK